MSFKNRHPRSNPLFPVACAMLLLIAVSVTSVYWLQQRQIRAEAAMKVAAFHQNLRHSIRDESAIMEEMLEFICENRTMQKEWTERDRTALIRTAGPMFQRLRALNHITHFYFITPDKKCFLRLHNPAASGDSIDRITLDIAEHQKKTVQGMELGPFGTFTLRVVRPWVVDGKLIGYLELGEEVEHISGNVSGIMDIKSLCTVSKQHLERKKWEEGLRMLGRTGDWNRFKNVVIIASDLKRIDPKLTEVLDGSSSSDTLFGLSAYGRKYIGGFDPLIDAGGSNIGKFVILDDITEASEDLMLVMIRLTLFSLSVAALLLAFLYRRLKRANGASEEARTKEELHP